MLLKRPPPSQKLTSFMNKTPLAQACRPIRMIYIKIREICIYKNIRVFIQDFGILTQFFALIYSIFWSGRPPRTPPKIGVISEKTFFFRSVFRKTSFDPLFRPFHAFSSSFSNSPTKFRSYHLIQRSGSQNLSIFIEKHCKIILRGDQL